MTRADYARELRADALHGIIQRRPDARTVAAVHGLGELWSWPSAAIDVAIADLVADGRVADTAHGRLIVRRRAA